MSKRGHLAVHLIEDFVTLYVTHAHFLAFRVGVVRTPFHHNLRSSLYIDTDCILNLRVLHYNNGPLQLGVKGNLSKDFVFYD